MNDDGCYERGLVVYAQKYSGMEARHTFAVVLRFGSTKGVLCTS